MLFYGRCSLWTTGGFPSMLCSKPPPEAQGMGGGIDKLHNTAKTTGASGEQKRTYKGRREPKCACFFQARGGCASDAPAWSRACERS